MKDFDSLNERKKKIDKKNTTPIPSKRQVWWVSMGLNVGDEEDGKNNNFERPVLIIKTFSVGSFLAVPVTSVNKEGKKYYCPITYREERYYVILSQIKLLSTKRLLRKITKISSEEFIAVKKSLAKTIGL